MIHLKTTEVQVAIKKFLMLGYKMTLERAKSLGGREHSSSFFRAIRFLAVLQPLLPRNNSGDGTCS